MTEDYLKEQIDYVQARIEEMDKLIINANPTEKGYKELVDSYNKWIDRYKELMDELKHFGEEDIEKAKLDFEKEKMRALDEIENDKIDLERERLRLDREKFAHDIEHQKGEELKEVIFMSAELMAKVAVPLVTVSAMVGVAKLSYAKDLDLELCNGRVMGTVKDLLKLATMKV